MNNPISRPQRSILITGCSTGIGLAAAQHLHALGYKVIASARRPADVQNLQAQGIPAVLLDTSLPAQVNTAVDEALKLAGGTFYAVFHNAGYGQSGALEDLPAQALSDQFQTNVFGAHAINQKLIPLMRKAGEGRIIWNSSILGFFAMPYRGAYNASKFAIEAMADTLRLELATTGIHVVLLEPGPIATSFRKNSLAAFMRHINPTTSVHSEKYIPFLQRLNLPGDTSKFTLPPQACLGPLIEAMENPVPSHRYRITTPTKIAAILKRLLPSTLLDKVALRGF